MVIGQLIQVFVAPKVRERLRVALERVSMLEDQLAASSQEVKSSVSGFLCLVEQHGEENINLNVSLSILSPFFQVISLRDQIKRRQQGVDSGKDVREGFMHVGSSCLCVFVSIWKVSRNHLGTLVRQCDLISHAAHLYFSLSLLFFAVLSSFQRLPNGPSSTLEDGELERQKEGEIERQRAELSQLRERLALMCRQVSV